MDGDRQMTILERERDNIYAAIRSAKTAKDWAAVKLLTQQLKLLTTFINREKNSIH